MENQPLLGKHVLVTGAARRIGRALALACASAGADVVIHYHRAVSESTSTKEDVEKLGRRAWCLQADFSDPAQTERVIEDAVRFGPLSALVNNAAIFGAHRLDDTDRAEWDQHLAVNLTAPYVLARAFARQIPDGSAGRLVNILDWRALRPGADHFAYTVSKAALAGLTKSLAAALAPRVMVNGLALGAILPPADGSPADDVLRDVPAHRWGELREVDEALLFLLAGPAYVTGEIIHVDGGRHLV